MRSIFYQSPFFYKLGLKIIHGENLKKRYRYMASFVRSGDLVLEPGCGPAILADFLPKDSSYYGFDLNEKFVDYARRKNLKVFIGDVLDYRSYFPADIIVSCDVLHHLDESNRGIFIENCWRAVKRLLIICEPYREGKPHKFWFEYIEHDGINSPKLEALWDEKTLKMKMESGFGIIDSLISKNITKVGKDFIAIYSKE